MFKKFKYTNVSSLSIMKTTFRYFTLNKLKVALYQSYVFVGCDIFTFVTF